MEGSLSFRARTNYRDSLAVSRLIYYVYGNAIFVYNGVSVSYSSPGVGSIVVSFILGTSGAFCPLSFLKARFFINKYYCFSLVRIWMSPLYDYYFSLVCAIFLLLVVNFVGSGVGL